MAKVRKFIPTGSKKSSPITKEQMDYLIKEFHDRGDTRMEIVIHLLYRVIRIGDVVMSSAKKRPPTLTIAHLYNRNGTLRDTIDFKEQKTGKTRSVKIAGELFVRALKEYWSKIDDIPISQPLFYGKRGTPLTDSGAKFLLSQFVGHRGLEQLSPHSLRKGGCRRMWICGSRIESISNVCNHHSSRVTEAYICITPADIEKSMTCLEI